MATPLANAPHTSNERYEARVGRALDLIETNLGRPPNLTALAEAACLSPYHFHRVFSSLVGESVHAFASRRRLELAVAMFRADPARRWSGIAEACGYRSLPVFSRAFKRHYGVSPRAFDVEAYWAARADGEAARSVSGHLLRPAPPPPDDFRVELVRRPAASLVGARAWGAYVDPEAPLAAYRRLVDWAGENRLQTKGGRLSGASLDDPEVTPLARCRYEFMLEVEPGVRPAPGLFARKRPEGWWAVHAVSGDLSAVDRAWSLLFKSWLPAAGLNLRHQPAEEVYVRTPEEIGWERYDLLCCVPVEVGEGRP